MAFHPVRRLKSRRKITNEPELLFGTAAGGKSYVNDPKHGHSGIIPQSGSTRMAYSDSLSPIIEQHMKLKGDSIRGTKYNDLNLVDRIKQKSRKRQKSVRRIKK